MAPLLTGQSPERTRNKAVLPLPFTPVTTIEREGETVREREDIRQTLAGVTMSTLRKSTQSPNEEEEEKGEGEEIAVKSSSFVGFREQLSKTNKV
jgi:hypothetical protein